MTSLFSNQLMGSLTEMRAKQESRILQSQNMCLQVSSLTKMVNIGSLGTALINRFHDPKLGARTHLLK